MMKQNTKRLLFISVVISLLALTALFGACVDGQTSVDESEYTITFATEGGTAIDPITVKSGEMAERPENPTKAGHIFKGWFTDLGNTETPFVFDETPYWDSPCLNKDVPAIAETYGAELLKALIAYNKHNRLIYDG